MARTADDRALGRSRPRAAVRGSEAQVERAFREAFLILDRRISLFLCLPLISLDSLALKKELDSIGQTMSPVPEEFA